MIRSLITAALLPAALAGCATGGLTRTELEATLTGHQQVPGPGDLGATGTALVRANPGSGEICWTVTVRGIDGAATGAAIRQAPAGSTGPIVLPLTAPDAAGRSAGCVAAAPALAREIAALSHLFYVEVTSAGFPNGALRGQLRGGFNPQAVLPPERR